jgi:predicted nucleotidyltransferase
MFQQHNINQTTLKILGLYRSDYERSLHLREVARETGAGVSPIHVQLKKLEKMKILSSAIKGRNKEYSPNLSNFLTKYYMTLAETFKSITYLEENFLIKKIISELKNRIEGTIILFGSFAKARATKESDVDLFIVTEQKSKAYINVMREVEGLTGRTISVKSASEMEFLRGFERGDPLLREVVSDHIILRGIDSFVDMMWRIHARPY